MQSVRVVILLPGFRQRTVGRFSLTNRPNSLSMCSLFATAEVTLREYDISNVSAFTHLRFHRGIACLPVSRVTAPTAEGDGARHEVRRTRALFVRGAGGAVLAAGEFEVFRCVSGKAFP